MRVSHPSWPRAKGHWTLDIETMGANWPWPGEETDVGHGTCRRFWPEDTAIGHRANCAMFLVTCHLVPSSLLRLLQAHVSESVAYDLPGATYPTIPFDTVMRNVDIGMARMRRLNG